MEEPVRLIKGKPCIVVSHCVHCGCVTFHAQSETCGCGAELYPVRGIIPLGEPIPLAKLQPE